MSGPLPLPDHGPGNRVAEEASFRQGLAAQPVRARGAAGAGRPALTSPCAACEGATGAGRILSSCPPSSHDAGRREPRVC